MIIVLLVLLFLFLEWNGLVQKSTIPVAPPIPEIPPSVWMKLVKYMPLIV